MSESEEFKFPFSHSLPCFDIALGHLLSEYEYLLHHLMKKWLVYAMSTFMDLEKLPFIIHHVQRLHKSLKNEDT